MNENALKRVREDALRDAAAGAPDFDAVLAHRRRRGRLRAAPIGLAAAFAVTAAAGLFVFSARGPDPASRYEVVLPEYTASLIMPAPGTRLPSSSTLDPIGVLNDAL